MKIQVKIDNDSFFPLLICPLQGDRAECKAIKNSPVNFCPESYEDEQGIYRAHFPKNCPLSDGPIIIKRGQK